MFQVLGLAIAWIGLSFNSLSIQYFGLHGAGLSVLIGLLAVLFLHSDLRQLQHLWQIFPSAFWAYDFHHQNTIHKFIGWNKVVRQSGVLELEKELEAEKDEYLNLGLQYIVDGASDAKLRQGLEVASNTRLFRWQRLTKLLVFLAKSSIFIGLCFSLLNSLDVIQIPQWQRFPVALLAPSIAALSYGVGLSCFFLYPLAARLSYQASLRARYDAMVIDGFLAILDNENARIMAHRLEKYHD